MIINVIKKISEVIGDELQHQIATCKINYKNKRTPSDGEEAAESEISEAEIRLLQKILPDLLTDLPPPTDFIM